VKFLESKTGNRFDYSLVDQFMADVNLKLENSLNNITGKRKNGQSDKVKSSNSNIFTSIKPKTEVNRSKSPVKEPATARSKSPVKQPATTRSNSPVKQPATILKLKSQFNRPKSPVKTPTFYAPLHTRPETRANHRDIKKSRSIYKPNFLKISLDRPSTLDFLTRSVPTIIDVSGEGGDMIFDSPKQKSSTGKRIDKDKQVQTLDILKVDKIVGDDGYYGSDHVYEVAEVKGSRIQTPPLVQEENVRKDKCLEERLAEWIEDEVLLKIAGMVENVGDDSINQTVDTKDIGIQAEDLLEPGLDSGSRHADVTPEVEIVEEKGPDHVSKDKSPNIENHSSYHLDLLPMPDMELSLHIANPDVKDQDDTSISELVVDDSKSLSNPSSFKSISKSLPATESRPASSKSNTAAKSLRADDLYTDNVSSVSAKSKSVSKSLPVSKSRSVSPQSDSVSKSFCSDDFNSRTVTSKSISVGKSVPAEDPSFDHEPFSASPNPKSAAKSLLTDGLPSEDESSSVSANKSVSKSSPGTKSRSVFSKSKSVSKSFCSDDLPSGNESLSISSISKSVAGLLPDIISESEAVAIKSRSSSKRSLVTYDNQYVIEPKSSSSKGTSSSDQSKSNQAPTSKSSSSNLSLTLSSLPTLSEGEIITQFYSQGQVIERSRVDYSEETGQLSESHPQSESVDFVGIVGVGSSIINTTHDDLSSTLERISAIEGDSF
jgi:hypothetical protein